MREISSSFDLLLFQLSYPSYVYYIALSHRIQFSGQGTGVVRDDAIDGTKASLQAGTIPGHKVGRSTSSGCDTLWKL